MEEKIKILVLGQIPPPFHGQAMMIHRLVKADFQHLKIFHVRMAFSESVKSVGRFNLKKLLHLPLLICQTLYIAFKYRITILYYPPAGPNLNPVLRDILILLCIRPFFKKTIFHFRAAGVSEFLVRSSKVLRYLGRTVYNHPNAAIQLSELNPPDGRYFNAEKVFVIENGLEDAFMPFINLRKESTPQLKILYTGAVSETKGILVILEAAKILREQNFSFHITCIGEFASRDFELQVNEICTAFKIETHVSFPGVKTGNDKWDYFLKADLFCFPSFFESESFGNVVVEAMMFELPVIATKWRGIAGIVDDGETGLLIPIKDAQALANSIIFMGMDLNLRNSMGKKGRLKFLSKYQLSHHLNEMEKMFIEVNSFQ